MSWLLTHMWMALAAVGLFGLLFGWSIRGILLVGKLRTARVDRDVAKTELEQARAEIEGLYAAQRNVTSGASDPHLKAELNVREKRMTELSAELARSKAELESLKTGAGRGVAATAPIVAKPPASGEAEEPTLLWRNRHLEGRVRHLEAALHEKAHDGAPGVSPAEAAAVTAMAASGSAADTTEADKLKWQADFLKQRVAALEAELADQPAATAVTETYPESDANEELARLRWRNRYLEGRVAYFEGDSTSAESAEGLVSDEPEEEPGALVSATDAILSELEEADAAADAEEVGVDELEDDESDFDEDEDFVEDDEEPDADSEDDDDDMETEDDADADDESEDEESLDEDAGEGEYDEDMDEDDSAEDDELSEDEAIDDEDEYEDVDAEDNAFEPDEFEDDESDEDDEDAEDDEDDESDDDELSDDGQVEAERPIALEKPVAGAPDDLTIIGGIGPKIQEVLNELGIFHYDQIAAWSPENISWIDNHLNFSGRIAREGWVEQAAILSGDVADE